MKKYLYICFFLWFSVSDLFAEGTKQIKPTATSNGILDFWYDTTITSAFARYNCKEFNRMNIRICNLGEKLYFGFQPTAGNVNDLEFRIKDPAGNIVFGPQMLPTATGQTGYINTYAEAVAGPAAIAVGGYNGFSYTPLVTGDYYVEFNKKTTANSSIALFDITVAGINNKAINGRLWSKNWQFSATGAGLKFDGKVYIYTTDGIVSQLDFNGIAPYVFTVCANSFGTINSGNFLSDRKSVLYARQTTAEYSIFLNDPDSLCFPSGKFGTLTSGVVITGCPGNFCINIEVDKAGQVDILLNINGQTGYQSNTTDRIIRTTLVSGKNCVTWDGKDGLGNPVSKNTNFNIDVNYFNGLTNIPIYDAEQNQYGFIVTPVRPSNSTIPALYWDDSNLISGTVQSTGCTGACHAWTKNSSNLDYGDQNTVNTWWYGNTSTKSVSFTNYTVSVDANKSNTGTGSANDTTICSTNTIPLKGLVAGTKSVKWKSKTGGTIANDTLLTTTYTFSTTEKTQGYAVLTITSVGGLACVPAKDSIKIIINKIPTVTVPANQVICNTIATTLASFSSDVTSSIYSWTNDKTSMGLAATGNGNIAAFTAANTGTTAITATVSVTPTAAGCAGSPKTFTYTVNPTPDVTVPANQTVCHNTTTTLASFSSNVTGATFGWINDKTSIGLAATGNGNIAAFTATNMTSAAVTATVTVTPTAATCVGTAKKFTYTINPTADVTVPANQTLCNNVNTASASFSSNVSTATFTWANDKTIIGLAASGNGNIAAFKAINASTSALIATVTVTPVSACPGSPKTFTYTINPTPDVILPADQTVCNNASTAMASFGSNVSGTSFVWANDNTSIGLAASGNGNIAAFTAINTVANSVTATVTVTPTAATCVGTAQKFTYTVNSKADVTVPANQTLCSNANTILASFSSNVSAATFTWTNDQTSIGLATSGTGNIAAFKATNTGTASVTATITVTPVSACTGIPKTFTYTVNPTPDAVMPANQINCSNTLTNQASFSSAVNGATFDWTNDKTSVGLAATGAGNIAAFTAENTGTTSVTATISVTPKAAGCTGSTKTFTYTVNPIPDVIVPAGQTNCSNTPTNQASFNSAVSGTTFDWTNDQNSIGLAPSGNGNIAAFTATNTGATAVTATISVKPTAAGCPGNPKTFTYTVNPIPDVVIPSNLTICNTTKTPFASFSSSVSGTTFAWTNDKTSIGLAASGTGDIQAFSASNNSNTGVVATVSVTPAANNCPGTPKSFTITVIPTPFVNAPADTAICETQTSMNIKGNARNFDAVSWSGGSNNFAPANDTTSIYTFTLADIQAGSIKLSLKADKTGCASVTDAITISFEKQATLSATDKEICETVSSTALTSVISNTTNTIWTTVDGKGTISQNGTNGINYTIHPHDTTLTDINFAIKTDGQVKCPAAIATLKLKLTDRPYIQAGTETICENTSLALVLKAKNMNSVTWTALNANGIFTQTDDLHGQYKPASGDTSNVILIAATTVNNPVCTVAKDTFKITVIGKPLLQINHEFLCTNFKTIPVTLISKHINGIVWKSLTGNGSINNTAPYIYTKGKSDSTLTEIQVLGTTVNNPACQTVNDVFVIKFISMPTLALDDKKCTEANLILDPLAHFNNPENATSVISWTKDKGDLGLTTPTISASGAGTYKVTYQYTGCSVSDSIRVLPLPLIITKTYNICEGNKDSIGVNQLKTALYEWSDGPKGTGLNKRPVQSNITSHTTYTVVVTDTDQCSNTASFDVDYTAKPILVTTGTSFCKGTTGTASVEVSNLASTNTTVSYQWLLNGKKPEPKHEYCNCQYCR